MHRSSFSVEEMNKIKRLHTAHGLDIDILAQRFGCSRAKIKHVLATPDDHPGDDVTVLLNKAPQQFKALVFINRRLENYGKFPTDQQLKDHLGYRNVCSVHNIKNKLLSRGWLGKNEQTYAWQLARALPRYAELIA